MSGVGVILYGPPASGKDTIGRYLGELSPRYRHYERIKVGPGRQHGYRIVSADALDQLRDAGAIVWENQAYGAVYAIDRPSLAAELDAGVPVVHLGQVAAVEAVAQAVSDSTWVVVDLWCPRDVAAARLVGRGSADVEERLRVWDATPRLASPDVTIDTSAQKPEQVAESILARAESARS